MRSLCGVPTTTITALQFYGNIIEAHIYQQKIAHKHMSAIFMKYFQYCVVPWMFCICMYSFCSWNTKNVLRLVWKTWLSERLHNLDTRHINHKRASVKAKETIHTRRVNQPPCEVRDATHEAILLGAILIKENARHILYIYSMRRPQVMICGPYVCMCSSSTHTLLCNSSHQKMRC